MMLYINETYFTITDYTDGVFETVLIFNGKPVFLKEHLSRFEKGLSYKGFSSIDYDKLIPFIKVSLCNVDYNKGALRIIGLKNKIVVAVEKKAYHGDLYRDGVALNIAEF